MQTSRKRAELLLSCAAVPLLFAGSSANAQTLSLLSGTTTTLTKTTSSLLGPITTTVASTTTATTSTVKAIAPITEPVLEATSPVVVTVYSAPGTVTTTVDAAGSIVANAPTSIPSLLLQGTVFKNPEANLIDPKWGKIRSFWGKIRAFEGEEVTPFWGKIRAFWGGTGPFEGDTAGWWGSLQTFNVGDAKSATPQWATIRTFWGDLGAQWGTMRTTWDGLGTYSDSRKGYAALAEQMKSVVGKSSTFWGRAVKAETGKDFNAGFANALLQRYGIKLDDPSTLAKLDPSAREHFFLEWYDGLMQFSGADSPDHWMRQVNWSPRLTETAGEGRDSVIGLLDFSVTGAEAGSITHYNGVSNFANGHGAAVASLMVAAHDGKGVMGIAPMASVVAYNPFDATETAGWDDIRNGIRSLGSHGASIINMSLGVSGWTLHPDWNAVFNDPFIALTTASSVFVIAAGNDGITQTKNLEWTSGANFVVVGSVDPAQAISDFSNRPGNACLTVNGKCSGDLLMNHFLVAPGEMMLVSDGRGGVTRYSGTSFAAPLVSGTAALIHDRWPWLSKHPKETVDILLKSATDLGAPGVDPVYGVGQLNVTKALSPLSLDKLTWYQMDDRGMAKPMSSSTIRHSSNLAKWEAAGMYFHAFETIGGSFRDFAIPLSTKLVDKSALSAGMSEERFQAYLYNQVADWIKKGPTFTQVAGGNLAATSAPVVNPYGLNLTMSVAQRTFKAGVRGGQMPYQTALNLADKDKRFALTVGEGDGAVTLGSAVGFGRAADYDPDRGGANPLLGMASGGNYARLRYDFSDQLSLAVGATEQDTRYDLQALPLGERTAYSQLKGYRTAADIVALTYRPTKALELTGSYTRLHEANALLGVQALDTALLDGGSTTSGLTLGAAYAVTPTLQVAASGTLGRTRSDARKALIASGSDGLSSTAFQLSIDKQHLLDRHDGLRLSLAQPLHVESGALSITSLQVVDRQTGELGSITQKFSIGERKRPLVGEFQYSRSMLDGQADLALFGRAQLAGDPSTEGDARLMTGLRLSLRY